MKLSPNEIQAELNRVRAHKYSQFVSKVRLKNVRGFADETIEFKSPVTALIGTNGGGKSTVLGSVAVAYKNVKPSQFFPKSFIGDDSMSEWIVEYELVDKALSKDKLVQRTAKFRSSKWRREDFRERDVEYIEIQRTVPAGEMTRFRRFLAGDRRDFRLSSLNGDTVKYSQAVLDKDVSEYKVAVLKTNPDVRMYVGATGSNSYSQFHFGAGEASIIDTIDRIENSEDNSLILIEELENGLHPVAVRAFVQYLFCAAKRKKLQVVFTTHSQVAIDELPPDAIWALINKRAWNGKLSIDSLRAITGLVKDERAVFVEDEFVQEWVQNAIGHLRPALSPTTRVVPAGGYPNILKACQYHNDNPLITTPALALVDGDLYDPTTNAKLPSFAMFLGDGVPEHIVFSYVYKKRKELVSVIRQRCLLSQFSPDRIIAALESVRNSSCDEHTIYTELSDKLDFASALHIRAGLIDIFNERNPEFWHDVIEFIAEAGQ